MASMTIGQGFKSGKAGGGGCFPLLPYHPATAARRPFWRTRESSKIFVEHAWPGADYK